MGGALLKGLKSLTLWAGTYLSPWGLACGILLRDRRLIWSPMIGSSWTRIVLDKRDTLGYVDHFKWLE